MGWLNLCSCRPLNQFCCGCSLESGVKFILILHFLQSLFYIVVTTSNIILKVPSYGYDVDMTTQTFNAAFALAGLPFIFIAWYGLSAKIETYVRLFLYYLLVQFALDMTYMLYYLLIVDGCSMLPSALKQHGSAFACGVSRIIMLNSVILVFAVDMYFMFAVWSYSEDLKVGAKGQGLPELLLSKNPKQDQYGVVEGLLGVGEPIARAFNKSYGALSTQGNAVGGSSRIFGGTRHETDFPPRPAM